MRKNENTLYSNTKQTTRGIIQGSATSSFYFSLFINDIINSVKKSNMYMFADDCNLGIAGPYNKVHEIIQGIEEDLSRIHEWLTSNKLKLNIDKTKMLVINKGKTNTDNISVKLGNSYIERVKELKILGVIFDEKNDFLSTC